ncbi:MAG TPA: hypothetical protein VHV75_01115 [Solirubrobacteraceae bacterium]|jgi:hypothetical protein|nr:hypothetical protein [Solirubrobacteraceae bacterium]
MLSRNLDTCSIKGSEHRATRAEALIPVAPGSFEERMPAIAQWFAEHPPGDTRGG